jgi:hypothetical protein
MVNMKRIILMCAVVGMYTNTFSQWAIPANMRAQNTLSRLSEPIRGLSNSDLLYGIPMEPGIVIGDNYLDKKWNMANILLYQSETLIEGYPVKYDVKEDRLEIKSKSGIKVLDSKKIRNLVWVDSLTTQPHYFVNGAEYRFEGVKSLGLIEVIVDGELPLLKKAEFHVKQPNYNAALDVGSRDTKLYFKEIYLYAQGKDLIKIKNKDDVLKAAGSYADEVESFIKVNKININKPQGLKNVFEFINSKYKS